MHRYTLDTEAQHGLVVLRVHEDTDAELALELTRAAVAGAGGADARGYLVDLRGTRNRASGLADYDLAYRGFEDRGLPRHVRVALLVDEADRSRDFFETLASNAGYSVRVFRDEQAARQWLPGR